jgi:hypothetical protein
MREEQDKIEDHQLLEVKILSEATIKMIKINIIEEAKISNMKMDPKNMIKIKIIIKVDIRNLNSNQGQLSLFMLSLLIQKKQNLKKSRCSPTNSK